MAKVKPWHHFSLDAIEKHFGTKVDTGLTPVDVARQQGLHGKNVLEREKRKTFLTTALEQFKSPLVFILLIAGIVTFYLHEYVDTIVIGIALSINVLVGAFQEERAGKAFEKLNQSRQRFANVLRSGKKKKIFAEELVPGDVLLVESGMYIPADARLIAVNGLSLNEAALTGEWVEVKKDTKEIVEGARITEQENMIWMGTLVAGGSGVAVVVATGGATQLGSIAKELGERNTVVTPLQKSIHKLATYITYAITAALMVIFVVGLLRGEPLGDLLLVAIAIAVAAIPSGLPAAVTVVLALGMEAILKRGGLVRNLLAAETLGSTTIILTDKTGTLTKAEMRVSSILSLTSFENKDLHKKTKKTLTHGTDERDVLAMAMLTSDAFVEGYDNALSEWVVHGRPVERAIMLAGLESGLNQEILLEKNKQLDLVPFNSEHRFSATLHKQEDIKAGNRMYFTGAPETLLGGASFVYENGKKRRVTKKIISNFIQAQEKYALDGMRVLALAFKDVQADKIPSDMLHDPSKLMEGLVFGGLIVVHDPVRADAAESIKEARGAGAEVIMLTGDNENTARRVAIEVGISSLKGASLTGKEVEDMTDKELLRALKTVRIFARVLPHQKMRIVKVLKESGEVVAMTGDGINDAPALRRADIGVALGSGTEVAKEASDIILINNSFTIIVRAIEEGRRILDNLKKIVAYLLSTSFSEIFVVGGAILVGAPLPLLPAQILWTNIIEEGFMNFAFAFEPKEDDVMKRNPRSHAMRSIVTPHLRSLIIILSLITGIILVALYFILLRLGLAIEEIRTIMFAVLSVDSIFFSFSLKDLSQPLWKINPFSNRYLLGALAISIGALLLALFVPAIRDLLSLVPVSGFDLMFVFIIGFMNLVAIEVVKYIYFEKVRS